MGNLANTIPFTELWERLLVMARIDSPNNEDYARGIINDVYTRTLPRIADWDPITKEGTIQVTAKYSTGTVSVNAAGTDVTGVGTTWTAGMTAAEGYRIKFSGNDNIYSFTYASGTTATISPALSGETNLSGVTYLIFKDTYSLASDFDRFLRNGSIYVMSGGRVHDVIGECKRDTFREEFIPDASDPIRRAILWDTHASTGYQRVRLNPPPSTAKLYPYEYVKQVPPMTDYQVGSAEVTTGSTAVVGTDTLWATNVAAGDYFRVDGNGTGASSKWYRVASVTDNTNIVLESNYGEASEAGMEYTISKSPTSFPMAFHEFILYESVVAVVGEQGDPTVEVVASKRADILSDLKKNYKTRSTNVQVRVEDGGYRSSWR